MIPEDRFTSTVSGAAAYERYRSSSYDDGYDRYDAMADDANDKYEEMVQNRLDTLCVAVEREVWALLEHIEQSGEDQPHPWTWERHLVGILDETESEDALREALEEHFREDAEDHVRDELSDYCGCNDYHCPG